MANLPPAGQGSAAGQLPHPTQERREAGFRHLGRLRAEFRLPPHTLRKCRLLRLLESRGGREPAHPDVCLRRQRALSPRSEEHTSELQSHCNLVCRLLLGKKHLYLRTDCCELTAVFLIRIPAAPIT